MAKSYYIVTNFSESDKNDGEIRIVWERYGNHRVGNEHVDLQLQYNIWIYNF